MPEPTQADHAWLVRFVSALARGSADPVDDLCQDAWLAAQGPSGRRGPLRPWLAGVARQQLQNRRRGDARRRRRERAAAPSEMAGSGVLDELARREVTTKVRDAVAALSPQHREVLRLRYDEGLPVRTIAVGLGLRREAVRSRLKRALRALRERLHPDLSERAFAARAARVAECPRSRWPFILAAVAAAAALYLAPAVAMGWNPLQALLPGDRETNSQLVDAGATGEASPRSLPNTPRQPR
ncbi:MAG: RNA polymerase sigma factor [Planctomycetota bacterium]